MHHYLAIVLAVSISSTALGEEIPLKSIWAESMPGTRDVHKLEKLEPLPPNATKRDLIERSLVERFKFPLARHSPSEKAAPGFAVPGEGKEALQNVFKRSKSVPADQEVSLVFFSHACGSYVHLDSVEREGNVFTITYHFVTHSTLEATTHFALIPVGKLPPGNYDVRIVRGPATAKDALVAAVSPSDEVVERIVCQPFSFTVK